LRGGGVFLRQVSAGTGLEFVAEQAGVIYRAFHARLSDLTINNLCNCDGCTQAGNLKVRLVGHWLLAHRAP
jgi:hypothetical protein